MSKAASVECIADIYLYELRKKEKKKSKETVQLAYLLDKKGIYYTQQLLMDVCKLVVYGGYADEDLLKMHGVGYDKNAGMTGGNIKALLPAHRLTVKGRDFVDHGQKLDTKGVEDTKEKRRKWQERGINALIAVVVFVLGQFIKSWLIDGKAAEPRQAPQPKAGSKSVSWLSTKADFALEKNSPLYKS
ncbi:MAG: hypothetical protein EOO15_18000 [Chitinophagaceae bacterium]|nr:MAG: hypothetical protein EOO15_18000 [Chitinophagaceae bacterium]